MHWLSDNRFVSFTAQENEMGIGICGWLLTAFSWAIVIVTLPFSLCVCSKVETTILLLLNLFFVLKVLKNYHSYRLSKNTNELSYFDWVGYQREAQKDQVCHVVVASIDLFSKHKYQCIKSRMGVFNLVFDLSKGMITILICLFYN